MDLPGYKDSVVFAVETVVEKDCSRYLSVLEVGATNLSRQDIITVGATVCKTFTFNVLLDCQKWCLTVLQEMKSNGAFTSVADTVKNPTTLKDAAFTTSILALLLAILATGKKVIEQ